MTLDQILGQFADRCADLSELASNAPGYGIAELTVRLESLADDFRDLGDAIEDEVRT